MTISGLRTVIALPCKEWSKISKVTGFKPKLSVETGALPLGYCGNLIALASRADAVMAEGPGLKQQLAQQQSAKSVSTFIFTDGKDDKVITVGIGLGQHATANNGIPSADHDMLVDLTGKPHIALQKDPLQGSFIGLTGKPDFV